MARRFRASAAPNVTPDSAPPARADSPGETDPREWPERYIWTSLVPRLVHPVKLAIVLALVEAARPLSVDEMEPMVSVAGGDRTVLVDHATTMVDAGALEIASSHVTAVDEIPLFYFPKEP